MSIKNRKLQVFVSSTYKDLKVERQVAVEAILDAEHIPAGMELFAAGDQLQLQVIRDWIRESDVYMLILGGRYGSIEYETGKSYTQLEYEYAVEIGIPHFAVVVTPQGLTSKIEKHGEEEVAEFENPEKYEAFKSLVMASKIVRFWDEPKDIPRVIFKSLSNFNKREAIVGWVRGDMVVNSAVLAEEMARLGKENSELRSEVERLRANSVADFGGIIFDDLFQKFENKSFTFEQIDEWASTMIETACYDLLVQHLEPSVEQDLVNGNDIILAFSPMIDGTNLLEPDDFFGFFNYVQSFGLIKYFPINSKSKVSFHPEFTDLGRKYLTKLRSLEKYKDWDTMILI